jgi:SAM-dependent methyltransferase
MLPRLPRLSPVRFCILFYSLAFAVLIAVYFPYDTDPPTAPGSVAGNAQAFYDTAYEQHLAPSKEEQAREEAYVRVATRNAELFDIKGIIRHFVKDFRLEDKRVLDVGAGRGYLQDMVDNYTGLDISSTARRYFHKRFVQASATNMPFKDGEFDAIWTVWVLEHIPNPESALREMRRVVKPGGLILLAPAWDCTPWAADGYEVRPYSDFGAAGKVVKASLAIRSAPLFHMLYGVPIRALRSAASRIGTGPTTFRYRRLVPNYKEYWVPDSDAVNSMDAYEAVLWFESRGDKCLSCPAGVAKLTGTPWVLVIRAKPGGKAAT